MRVMGMRVSAHYNTRGPTESDDILYGRISQVKWTDMARCGAGTIVICIVIVCDNTFITLIYAYIISSVCLTFYGRHISSAHTNKALAKLHANIGYL